MASDPELAADHLRAQALQAKFNATAADAEEGRRPFWCNCSAVFKSAPNLQNSALHSTPQCPPNPHASRQSPPRPSSPNSAHPAPSE